MTSLKWYNVIFSCLLIVTAHAEGTKQLRPTEGDFGYINLMDQQNNLGTERTFALYDATDDTRLNIRIQNATTEKILMGFKMDSDDPIYYRIKDPNGNIIVAETLLPQDDGDPGVIEDYDEAIAGPDVVDVNGYIPIVITPTLGVEGDYSIEFRDPNHNPPTTYAKRHFELFDITVVDDSNQPIDGRLWSKAWDITTTALTRAFNGSVYIYTNDGITTQAEFNGFEAWSFIIQSNSTGPNSTGDVLSDRQSIDGGQLLPEYKIFLTTPDETEFPVSQVPEIVSSPNIDLCNVVDDYCIDVELSNPGVVEYVIDIDGDVGFDHSRDVQLTSQVVEGVNCLAWDGRDGEGNLLTSTDTFDVILSYQAGVTHLFIHDAENNPIGFNVSHVSPDVGLGDPLLYYDDVNVGGSTLLDGCSSDCHQWDSNDGNNKTINTWWVTYFENDTLKDLILSQASIPASVEIEVDSPPACGSGASSYSAISVQNGGDSPIFAWWINQDSIQTGSTFSTTSLEDGDRVYVVVYPSIACGVQDTAMINVTVDSILLSINEEEICEGETTTLIVAPSGSGTNYSYSWSPTSNLNISTQASVMANPTITTSFKVVVEDENGCVDSVSTLLIVHENPTVTVDNEEICEGEEVALSANVVGGTGALTYNWSPVASTLTTVEVSPTTTTSYKVVVADENSCQDSTTATVTVHETPTVTVDNEEICEGEEVTLSANVVGGTGVLTYNWSPVASTLTTVEVSPTTTTSYKVVVTDENSCQDSTTATVTVHENPMVTVDNEEICEGEEVTLSANVVGGTGALTYSWSPVASTLTTVEVSPTTTTSYKVVVTDENSCQDSTTATVTVHENPIVTIENDTICEGDIGQLTALVSNGFGTISYTWPSNNSTQTSIDDSPTETTTYTILVSYENDCEASAIGEIVVTDQPTVALSDIQICEGESTTLTPLVEGTNDAYAYRWVLVGTGDVATAPTLLVAPTTDQNYEIHIETEFGCEASDEATVSVVSKPTVALSFTDTTICEGESVTLVVPSMVSEQYQWYYSKDKSTYSTIGTTAEVEVGIEGYYVVQVSTGSSCQTLSDTIQIGLEEVAVEIQSSSTLVYEGDEITLVAQSTGDVVSYEWSTPNGDLNTQNITTIPLISGTYEVEASTSMCAATDEIDITVLPPIIIPNGYSPNDDDKNEAWFIKGLEAYEEVEVIVYNRWGNEVYRSIGYEDPWIGINQNGEDLPDATYYYLIYLNDPKGQEFKGSVTIIR